MHHAMRCHPHPAAAAVVAGTVEVRAAWCLLLLLLLLTRLSRCEKGRRRQGVQDGLCVPLHVQEGRRELQLWGSAGSG